MLTGSTTTGTWINGSAEPTYSGTTDTVISLLVVPLNARATFRYVASPGAEFVNDLVLGRVRISPVMHDGTARKRYGALISVIKMMRSTLNGESLNMDAASLQLIPSPNIQTGITGWYGSWEVGDCRWISGRYSVCFFWDGTELIGQDYRDLPIYSPPGWEV